jgi:3',5'-cyclic AMP phosphodiesterase CpdA
MIKFVHISDLHFPVKIPFWQLKGKMFSGYFNYALRRRSKYKPEAIRAMVHKIKSLPYDVLIISGDLTNVSHEKEFQEAKKLLHPILNEKTFMIPGNHDRYLKDAIFPNDLFLKYFGDYTGVSVNENTPHYNRMKEVNGYLLFGWDSNGPTGFGDASGFVEPMVVEQTIEKIKSENKPYLITCHHPIWNPSHKQESSYHKMRNRNDVLQKILDHPPLAYFHGHIHTNWIKKPSKDVPFYIFNSASSTRMAEKGYFSGFHFGSLNENQLEVNRYNYVLEANDYLETSPVYFS